MYTFGNILLCILGALLCSVSVIVSCIIAYSMPELNAFDIAFKYGFQVLAAFGAVMGIVLAFTGFGRAID